MASISPARRRRRSSYNLRPQWLSVKRMVAFTALGLVLFGGVFGYRVVAALGKLTHQNAVQVIGGLLGGSDNSAVGQQAKDLHRINIAMYGYGGVGHDGAYLSDSILVVSIQPQPSGLPTVAEISLPRDWYVPIQLRNGLVHQRINYAWAAGMDGEGTIPSGQQGAGAAVADATLENLLGLHIDHYVGVDFDAFKQGVDAVGGIDVTVPNTFTDYQYPAGECGGNHPNCAYMTAHFNAGPMHMNGSQALIFSRSRHGNNGEGSDFARSHRQQLVVAALKQKVVSIGGIGSLPDLINALGDHVTTDLQVGDIKALYELVKGVDQSKAIHVSLDDTTFLYECGYPANCGAAYLYAHDRTLASIKHFMASVFIDPAVLSQNAKVTIEDGSGRGAGAEVRWSRLFNTLGLTTSGNGTVPKSATTQVIDNSGGRNSATAVWLAKYFGVTVQTATPAPAPASGAPTPGTAASGVTVILGVDEERTFNAAGTAID